MKRIFSTLIAAVALGMSAMAQESLVATLQHGSNLRTFYGDMALSAAHDAAANGDIITLSAGKFQGCDVTKAITLRAGGEDITNIVSPISFTVPSGTVHSLTVEGLGFSFAGDLIFSGTAGGENVVVSKCKANVSYHNARFLNVNATIVQSRFEGTFMVSAAGTHLTCLNSILGNIEGSAYDIQNCNLLSGVGIDHSQIKNSIVYWGNVALGSSNTSSHCLVLESSTGFADSWRVADEDGNSYLDPEYVSGDDHRLSDEAAQAYLGTDGTQVGIYGGMHPYNTMPDYSLVKKLDVIGSHQNGKLKVRINVE